MAEKTENTKNRLTGMLLSKNRRAQYIRLFAVLAACVAVVVAVVLHQNGVAMTHEEKVLTCPVEGVVAHMHNESCYDADGNLVCTLPERALHTHSDGCYTEKRELSCGLEESEGHKHTDACYDANTGALTCGKEESEGHKHTDACYTVTRELACGQEEVTEEHVHGPGCFTTVQVKNNEPAANAMPAQNFTGELKDQDDKVVLKVEVEAPEGAFPANTTMEIKAIDTNEVKGAVDEAVAQKTKDKVTEAQAVDITFKNKAGEEIEPAKEITVRFVSDIIAQNENSYVVHMNDNGKGDVVDSLTDQQLAERDQKAAKNELYVDAKEFSPYVLVGTKAIATEVLANNGNRYTVTVSYDQDAKIPAGAELAVSEVSRATKNEDGKYYVDLAEELLNVKKTSDENIVLFDISIMKDGEKVQPAAPVNVEVKLNDTELTGTDGVVHFGEKGTEVLDATTKNEAVSFETSSFSIYAFKGISDNEDGTYNLTLGVEGTSSETTKQKDINVIFVLDKSNSMRQRATSTYGSLITWAEWDAGRGGASIADYYDKNSAKGYYNTNNDYQYFRYYQLYKKVTTNYYFWSTEKYVPITDAEKYTGTLYVRTGKDSYKTVAECNRELNKEGVRVSGANHDNIYMSSAGNHQDSRLYQTNAALKTVMQQLAAKNTSENNDAVEMLLIEFGSSASPNHGNNSSQWDGNWKTSAITLPIATGNDTGATNWQAALNAASNAAARKYSQESARTDGADDTYIVFLTDGEPTQPKNNIQDNVNAAKQPATTLNNNYAGLHLVFAYGADDNNYLESLDHTGYYKAESTESLVEALTKITSEIDTTGYEQVVYNDGITSLTSTLVAKNVDSVTYTRYKVLEKKNGKFYYKGTNTEVPSNRVGEYENSDNEVDGRIVYYDKNSGEAYEGSSIEYGDDKVLKWRLGEVRLENNWLYTVTFRVWPSQAAYDLVADLNNGARSWNSLTEEEKKQVTREGTDPNYTYKLKTNTDGTKINYNEVETSSTKGKLPDHVTKNNNGTKYYYDNHEMTKKSNGIWEYKDSSGTTYTLTVTTSNGTTIYKLKATTQGTVNVQNPEPVHLEDTEMAVAKIWNDDINNRNRATSIDFTVYRDGEEYKANGNPYVIHLDENNQWRGKVDIAPGLMTVKEVANSDDTIEVLETGHDYTVSESTSDTDYTTYSFEFKAETVRPMIINGALKYLVLVPDDYQAAEGEKTYVLPNVKDNSKTEKYVEKTGNDVATLKGTNYKTSEFDITKQINALTDKNDTDLDQEEFTYQVVLTVPEGSNTSGIKIWTYTGAEDGSITMPEYGDMKVNGSSTGVSFNGNSATAEVTINRKQIVRFTNLPTGTTYTITETKANGKSLAEEGYTLTGVGQGITARPAPTAGKTKATGTITDPATRYYNNFENKLDSVDANLGVEKELSGYQWKDGNSYEFKITANEGTPMPKETTVMVDSAESLKKSFGAVRYTKVGEYTYTVTETNAGQTIDGIEYGAAQTIKVTVARDTTTGRLKVTNIDKNYTAATNDQPASGYVKITNTLATTEVTANKAWKNADGSNTAPANATVTFTLYADGTETGKNVTLDGVKDDAGNATEFESSAWTASFKNLPIYNNELNEIQYTVKEKDPYNGYAASPDSVATTGTITNTQVAVPIEITKIGDWTISNKLANVEFQVYSDENCRNQITKDVAGNNIGNSGKIVTDNNGKAAVGSFGVGTYYLKEIKPADGYLITDGVATFTVNNNGTVTYTTGYANFDNNHGATYTVNGAATVGLYISNTSGTELPETGGIGTTVYYIAGATVAAVGLYGLYRRRNATHTS